MLRAIMFILCAISSPAVAGGIISCEAPNGGTVRVVENGMDFQGTSLNCIEGDFVADLTPCAPNGGYGLSYPTGAASISGVVYRWQDYGNHYGGVVQNFMTATTVYFQGGRMSDFYSEEWSFELDKITGVGALQVEGAPRVTYQCASVSAKIGGDPAPATDKVTQVNFDDFLRGIESCELGDQWGRFIGNVSSAYSLEGYRGNGVITPKNDEPIALGDAYSIRPRAMHVLAYDDYFEAEIPVSGTYYGVPLRKIFVVIGRENGFSVKIFEFAASREEIIAKFGRSLDRANKRIMSDFGAEGQYSFVSEGEPGQIICDSST